MFDREQDHFLELFFGFFKTTDIFPLDVGYFDVSFSQRGRVDAAHSEFEVFLSNRHGLKDLSINFVSFNVNDIHLLTDALKSRFCAQGSNISSYETMGFLGDSFKVDIFRKFHVFGVNSQDFQPTDFVRDTNIDFSVESTESSESGVDGIRSVGGSNDNNVSSSFETVHKGKHLRDDSSFDLTVNFLSVGGD